MTALRTDTSAADTIRAASKGIYSMETAAELLIRTGLVGRGPLYPSPESQARP